MAETNLKKGKDGYGYKYTDLAGIHNYLEQIGMRYRQIIETDTFGNDYIVTIPIKADTGDELTPCKGCRVVQASLSGKSNAAQEQGSALTYARRYSLLMAFGLATTDDDAACMTVYTNPQTEAKDRAAALKKLNDLCDARKITPTKLCEANNEKFDSSNMSLIYRMITSLER